MLASLQPVLYVQLSPDRLTVRNARTGEFVSEVPEVALSRDAKRRVLGAGAEARAHRSETAAEVVNPFGHPRTLVSDFSAGEQLLKAFIRRVHSRTLLAVSPKVVLHPQGDPEGGFTQIEVRALQEMALGAGAAQVTIWQGRGLTDQELQSGQFPADGRVLTS